MVFGLAQLTHDKVPFDLGDGDLIYFQRREDLSPKEFGLMSHLEKRANLAMTRMEKAKDAKDVEKVVEKLKVMQNEFVALILPDMPEDVRSGLSITQQTAIIQYWRDTEEAKKGPGENEENLT